MPGERLEDALAAAAELQRLGIGAVLTRLGENITDLAAAEETTSHYVTVAAEARARSLDCHISVKLTQLGIDVDEGRCRANLFRLANETQRRNVTLWIDMEQSVYVDRTLDMRRALRDFPHVGVCLQAYLYRTADDLSSLIPLGGGVRLVKGAYREPASVAYPRKSDVDANYFRLATHMLAATATGLRAVFGTHDRRVIEKSGDTRTPPCRTTHSSFICSSGSSARNRSASRAMAFSVKTLISYGEQWFPWYMRRLRSDQQHARSSRSRCSRIDAAQRRTAHK